MLGKQNLSVFLSIKTHTMKNIALIAAIQKTLNGHISQEVIENLCYPIKKIVIMGV